MRRIVGEDPDFSSLGEEMWRMVEGLYPICRSITGEGLRETLRVIGEHIPLRTRELPTGKRVLDWTIPMEWNVREAFVENSRGERVIDFEDHNLHLLGYSHPLDAKMGLAELKKHLHTLPDHPDWIPYRTSYYDDNWGFCLSQNQLEGLPEDSYHVRIDTTLEEGHLSYGECIFPGEVEDEVLLSCHACHPSMCNDNLSGIALTTTLGKLLSEMPSRRFTYHLLFAPATIGAIAWLSENLDRVGRVRHGLVVTCVGDPGHMTYKRSRRGTARIDRAVELILRESGEEYEVMDFSPWGYDERQYCSPGFDMEVGSLTRSSHGRYPEYHTSADDLDLVRPEHLSDSLRKYLAVIDVLENDRKYLNTVARGEPQLGRRGLYRAVGGGTSEERMLSLLWVLNLSDGDHGLMDIAKRSGLPFRVIREAAGELLETDLLREI
jgi:aminopeptidase-like protein